MAPSSDSYGVFAYEYPVDGSIVSGRENCLTDDRAVIVHRSTITKNDRTISMAHFFRTNQIVFVFILSNQGTMEQKHE